MFRRLLPAIIGLALTLPAQAAPVLSAKSAILIDGETGQVLFSLNEHAKRPPASTTKIMSAFVALQKGRLNDVVTISSSASGLEGSSIYLEPGERLSLEQLLYGVMLESGNDACAAVAEHIGTTEANFVQMMNQEAQSLGLKDTHFSNPHGLPTKEHYSSAHDLATIARYALSNPEFAQISGTRTKEIPGNSKIKVRLLNNHNKLLNYFPGATGGKTGYTHEAGRCFVGSARRNGRFVIEALLDSPTLWQDAETLLNYGLDQFDTIPIAMGTVGKVRVKGGAERYVDGLLDKPLTLSVPKGQTPQISTQIRLDPEVQAPVGERQAIGTYAVFANNALAVEVPIYAAHPVAPTPPIQKYIWMFFGGIFKLGLFGLTGLGLLKVYALHRRRKLRARMRRKVPRRIIHHQPHHQVTQLYPKSRRPGMRAQAGKR